MKLSLHGLTSEKGIIKSVTYGFFNCPIKRGDLDFDFAAAKLHEKADAIWGAYNWRLVKSDGKSLDCITSHYAVSDAPETEGDTLSVGLEPIKLTQAG